jgi:hypothetical protein
MPKRSNAIGKSNIPPYRQKATVKNSYTSPARIALAQKRNEALGLRKQGYTHRAIAERMGEPLATVHGWIVEAIREITAENAAEVQALMLDRLDDYLVKQHESAVTGDKAAVETALRIEDRRAKLLNLYPDAKQGVGVSVTTGDGNGKTTAIEVTFVEPIARDDDED